MSDGVVPGVRGTDEDLWTDDRGDPGYLWTAFPRKALRRKKFVDSDPAGAAEAAVSSHESVRSCRPPLVLLMSLALQ